MIEKIANITTEHMILYKIIPANDKEYYSYKLILLIEGMITGLSLVALSVLLDRLDVMVVFYVSFMILRTRTGGFHVNSFIGCYFSTIAIACAAIYIIPLISGLVFLVCSFVISTTVICRIGVVNHPNVELDESEIKQMKIVAKRICVLDGLAIIALYICDVDIVISCCISTAMLLCAILMFIAKVRSQEVKEYER